MCCSPLGSEFEGWDNPFTEGGTISRDAEVILRQGFISLHPLELTPNFNPFQTVEGAETGPVWEEGRSNEAAVDSVQSRHSH